MNTKIKAELIKILNMEMNCYDGAYIIYSKNIIEIIIKNIYKTLSSYRNIKCLYSIKANLNSEIISFVSEFIDGFDVASWKEYQKVKNYTNKIMSISGYAFTKAQIENIATNNNFDFVSINQFKSVYQQISGKKIGIRVSCQISGMERTNETNSRFGFVYEVDIKELKQICMKNNIIMKRIHVHSGQKSIENLMDCVTEVRRWLDEFPTIEEINLGGGWDYIFDINQFKEVINKIAIEFSDKLVFIEPGSLLVRKAGILVSQVIDYKVKSFNEGVVILDSSSFNLSSWFKPKVIAIRRKGLPIPLIKYDLCGNTCYEEDIFQKDQSNPIGIGDIIYLYPTGAYYNSTYRRLHDLDFPVEILI